MNKTVQFNNLFEKFRAAEDEAQLSELAALIKQEGFTGFRIFLEQMKEYIKQYSDASCGEAARLVAKARKCFPEPAQFSPSWQSIWIEYEQTVQHKSEVLSGIPMQQRQGEWQVLMDNPYTNDSIVCYPGLSFDEAAYLYAYFQTDLKNNEYIRLQKIDTLLMTYGSDRK